MAKRTLSKTDAPLADALSNSTDAPSAQEVAAVWVPRSALHAWAENPRKNDGEPVKKVMESIRRFGFAAPIVARTNGEVIAGHTRLKAAEALGLDRVPVRYMDLDPAEAHLLALADNKLNEEAEWDASMVASILSDFSFEDAALAGWDSDDLDKLADELGANAPREVEDDEVPEPPAVAVTKPGDLWLLGEHRLLCGDSTKSEDVARLMQGEQADLLLTDPPYNVNYEGGTGLKIQNDSMPDQQFRQFLNDAFRCAFDACKAGASFYIWHADSEGYNFRGAVADCQQKTRQCLIWAKSSLVLGRQDYQWQHEPCLYGWKDGASHSWYNDRKQTTLLHFDKPSKNGEHPTMKPVSLFGYLIGNSTAPHGIAYDPFLGSGTTLIAAEQTQRKCYGMEIDPHYCDVIVKRWETLTGKKAELAVS